MDVLLSLGGRTWAPQVGGTSLWGHPGPSGGCHCRKGVAGGLEALGGEAFPGTQAWPVCYCALCTERQVPRLLIKGGR